MRAFQPVVMAVRCRLSLHARHYVEAEDQCASTRHEWRLEVSLANERIAPSWCGARGALAACGHTRPDSRVAAVTSRGERWSREPDGHVRG